MKRGILVLVLLFVIPFVNAVPTFNLFSGDALCGDEVQTGYSVHANVYDGVDSFNVSGSISDSGKYVLIVGATNLHNVSFYVDNVLIKTLPYDKSLIEIDNDLSLASDHDLCYVEDDDGDGNGGGGGDGNGDSGGDTVNDPIVNDTDDDEDDAWSQTESGTLIDVTNQIEEIISYGGDYVLVLEEESYDFSVYEVNSETAKIWIDDAEYLIPSNSNLELSVGDSIVLVSYLGFQDDLVKLSFQNAGVRATMMNTGVLFVIYLVIGLLLFLTGVFFLIRKLYANKSEFKKPSSEKDDSGDEGLLAGPKK
jgi:hypothetical protein